MPGAGYYFEVMKNAALPLLAVLGFFLFRTKDNLVNRLRYSFDRVNLSFAGGILRTKVTARMTITNPTNSTLKIQNITGDIVYNGTSIGRYSVNQPFSISAQQNTQVPILANVSNTGLLSGLVNMLIRGDRPTLKLDGLINTSLGSIPYDYAFKVQMPQIRKPDNSGEVQSLGVNGTKSAFPNSWKKPYYMLSVEEVRQERDFIDNNYSPELEKRLKDLVRYCAIKGVTLTKI